MAADRLPLEIIEEILKYLNPSDRLTASVVCRTWYEASLTRENWKDLALSLENSLDDAAYVLRFTRKPIQHIKIKDINFSCSTPGLFKFWNHISPQVVSLEIHKSYVTEAVLLNLLLPCQSLVSLHFHDCRDTFITGKLFSNDLVVSHIKLALPNLKELCFSDNGSYLSDALFDRFMTLVSSLTYLSLAGTAVSFHPGIHKKFYPENKTDGNKSSELVFTFDCILGHVDDNRTTVKYLDFSRTPIDDKACVSLSKVGDLKLRSLLLCNCEVTSAGITALCATQSSLTELDVSSCARVTDVALQSICNGLPNLQKLSLKSCRAVTDVGISLLTKLSHLKEINLQGLQMITSLGVEQGLLSKPNVVLRKIYLGATRITEETLHQLAVNAPFLTHLDLTSCIRAVTDSSLRVIWKSLLRLRELRLDWCVSLTDDGFGTVKKIQSTNNDAIPAVVKKIAPQPQLACELPEINTGYGVIKDLRGLVYLSINGCNKITDRSLQQSFDFCDLRYLDLNACSLITDEGLVALSEQNRGLEVLILNYCRNISDGAMIKTIGCLGRLKRLGLHGCFNLTNTTLGAIEKCQLRHLNHLDISHCKLISLEYAFQLQLRMPSIKELVTAGLE